jgi:hypothetical protein
MYMMLLWYFLVIKNMKTIVYPDLNNQISVMYQVDFSKTIEEMAQELLGNKEYTIFENLYLDPYFFSCYEYFKNPENGEVEIKINFEKAKEIQKNYWRELRKPILEKLDVDFMKALEVGNTQQIKSISEKKQILRDITKTLMINNLDDIKITIPNILKSE